MGISTLRKFADCLSNICANATDITQVAEALGDEEHCLRAAWDEIPKESKTIIVDRLKKKKKRRRTKPPSKKPVTISKDVEPLLKSWGENPSTFTLPATTLQVGLDHPAQLYVSLMELNRNRDVDAIRWRLYLLAFCELKDRLERVTVRGKTERVFENIVFNSNLVADSLDEVVQKCSLWANLGRRYQKLARSLGGRGSLIVLSEDTPRYKLEHTIPMKEGRKRAAYDTLIQGLKERGICEEATRLDAHKIADGILEYLCPKSCIWMDRMYESTGRRSVTALSEHFHRRLEINPPYDAIQADKESAALPDFYSDQNQSNAGQMGAFHLPRFYSDQTQPNAGNYPQTSVVY